MKVSYNWLKNYVDFNLSPNDLGEVLTGVGLEVEGIAPFETIEGGLEGVVVGEVKECSKHPDADKLSITKVDVGTNELLQIVCGAPNVAAGQKVMVALVGSVLYPFGGDKIQIKKAKIRGVESYGMICAEDELGLAENHAGILVLPASTSVGTKAADFFKVEKDYVLEIGLTPNRGDANSHIGVARDISAALNVSYQSTVSFTKPDNSSFKKINDKIKIDVEVKDTEACTRYSGVCLSGVQVADSPDWLKNKLKAIGVKSVNNVVDITNFVMHEYGQPLHAFDADKIEGNKVVVQKLPAQKFKTLDGNEVLLQPNDLLICDSVKPICIAGVYGGAHSGVSNSTVNIFLESACFSSTSIRKTGTRLNLRTDAATHFEKGTDPNITVEVLKRAAILITEICGGEVSSEIVDLYTNQSDGWRFSVSYNRIVALAGFDIPKKTILDIFRHLEISVESETNDGWQLLVPAFKTDVKREADIVEEIVRVLGYNSFALPKNFKTSLSYSAKVNAQKLENTIADLLCGAGFNEIWTNSVTQSKFEQQENFKREQILLLNSQTTELDSLRTSMLYSGLETVAHNQNRKATDLRLFEFGTTYHKNGDSYTQKKHLQILLTGKANSDDWLQKANNFGFFHLKSFVSNVLTKMGHTAFDQEVIENQPWAFALKLYKDNIEVACIGSIASSVLKKFDIKNEVYFADINWDYLLDKSQYTKTEYQELPKFPSVKRDLAMILGEEVAFNAIEKIAVVESKKLLQGIALFDVYKGDKMEKGKKSCAVSFTFQHHEKTLTDQEIERLMNRLMSKYETELGAVIRKG